MANAFPLEPDYRSQLAREHHNLGISLFKGQNLRDAEAALRRAIELHEKLVKDFPSTVDYQEALSNHYASLGRWFDDTERTEKAVEAYEQAIRIKEKLVKDSPKPVFRAQL